MTADFGNNFMQCQHSNRGIKGCEGIPRLQFLHRFVNSTSLVKDGQHSIPHVSSIFPMTRKKAHNR